MYPKPAFVFRQLLCAQTQKFMNFHFRFLEHTTAIFIATNLLNNNQTMNVTSQFPQKTQQNLKNVIKI